MPIHFIETEDLANALRGRGDGAGIIGIDGWTGVGKTTLARSLGRELSGAFYDLDCALTRDRNAYVSALRLSEISKALREERRPLFVAGICLLEVFARIGSQPDIHVYLKRMATWGWADEDEIAGAAFEIPGSSGEAIRHELRLYHQKWQPHLHADYEFHRGD